jgi:hypothetical protein
MSLPGHERPRDSRHWWILALVPAGILGLWLWQTRQPAQLYVYNGYGQDLVVTLGERQTRVPPRTGYPLGPLSVELPASAQVAGVLVEARALTPEDASVVVWNPGGRAQISLATVQYGGGEAPADELLGSGSWLVLDRPVDHAFEPPPVELLLDEGQLERRTVLYGLEEELPLGEVLAGVARSQGDAAAWSMLAAALRVDPLDPQARRLVPFLANGDPELALEFAASPRDDNDLSHLLFQDALGQLDPDALADTYMQRAIEGGSYGLAARVAPRGERAALLEQADAMDRVAWLVAGREALRVQDVEVAAERLGRFSMISDSAEVYVLRDRARVQQLRGAQVAQVTQRLDRSHTESLQHIEIVPEPEWIGEELRRLQALGLGEQAWLITLDRAARTGPSALAMVLEGAAERPDASFLEARGSLLLAAGSGEAALQAQAVQRYGEVALSGPDDMLIWAIGAASASRDEQLEALLAEQAGRWPDCSASWGLELNDLSALPPYDCSLEQQAQLWVVCAVGGPSPLREGCREQAQRLGLVDELPW